MISKASKKTLKDLVLILIPSFFILFYNLGGGSLASWDEGMYALVSKEMFQSGDWLKLTYSGKPWVDKPPLCLWATSFFYSVFGIGEFAARAWSALCGVGTVVLTYLIGRELFDRWTGLLAALVLLSSMHFIRIARFGMMDAPLTFFLSLALYLFWKGQRAPAALFLSGLAFGFAVLVKSFAALFILAIVLVYCLWAGQTRLLKSRVYWLGLLSGLAVALPWFVYEFLAYSDQFVEYGLTWHVFGRTFQALQGHGGNAYFYIRVLVNKYHPWILIGVVSAPFFLFKALRERKPEFIFLSVWMFLILAVITFMQTKIAWYIVPVYPALSISIAYLLVRVFRENYKPWVYAVMWVILLLHIPYSHIFHHDYSRSLKGIAVLVKEKVPPEEEVALYDFHDAPAAQFYLERRIAYVDTPASFEEESQNPPFYCLIRGSRLKILLGARANPSVSVLGTYEELSLVASR